MHACALTFADAGFPYTFFALQDCAGRSIRRWLPYGMPQLNQPLLDSVFFLYRKGENPGEYEGPFGTGVMVGTHTYDGQFRTFHCYAVTAHHVQDKPRAYVIRIGTRDGKVRHLDVDASDWHSEVNGPDLAVADVTAYLGASANEYFSYAPVDMFCTEARIQSYEIGIGESGFMIGLFADIPGKETNMIAGRFGNIALMAHPEAKMKIGNGQYAAHLFDIRSRPGFSGSPVWIYRVPTDDLRQTGGPGFTIDANNRFMLLLGIHVAQFNDYVEEIEIVRRPGQKPRPVKTGKQLQIPNSVTKVVPAWEIERLLNNHPELQKQRKARHMDEQSRRLMENTPTPEAVPDSDAEPGRPATHSGKPAVRRDAIRAETMKGWHHAGPTPIPPARSKRGL